ncbi:hypothetical protein WJX73_002500 [Symbiochloris irregularis]|uniref:Uncharacterized protein n=1 Tax=Symbiochloris irregularis TaxID=706552 RepID=A0AAW1PE54_9CHLO
MASYVQSAADGVKSAGQSTAEAVKPYVGESVANAVQSAGEYGKAGIEKAAEYTGLKEGVGQDAADSAKTNLKGAEGQLKNAAHDASDAVNQAGHEAKGTADTKAQHANANAESTYDSAVQGTKDAYEAAKQSTADALQKGADKLQASKL